MVVGTLTPPSPGGELSEGPSPSHDSGESLEELSVLTLSRWESESSMEKSGKARGSAMLEWQSAGWGCDR